MTEIRTGRRFPFVITPLWVVDHPDVTPFDVAVYIAIRRHADVTGEAWPSRARIAEVAKCSVDTVDRAVKRLIDIGALEKEVRRNKNGEPTSNLYTIHEEPTGYRSDRGGSRSQRPGVAAQTRTKQEPKELDGASARRLPYYVDLAQDRPLKHADDRRQATVYVDENGKMTFEDKVVEADPGDSSEWTMPSDEVRANIRRHLRGSAA